MFLTHKGKKNSPDNGIFFLLSFQAWNNMNCVIKQWLVRYLFQNYQLIKPGCSDFLKGLFCSHNKNTVCDDVGKRGNTSVFFGTIYLGSDTTLSPTPTPHILCRE